MIKTLFLSVALCPLLFVSACALENQNNPGASIHRPEAMTLLRDVMPGAMDDGAVKIAVLVHEAEGDNARQFLEGCVSEGRSLGFTVDSFVSGGDDNRCAEIAAGIARADYDGLVFTNGAVNFSYDILKPAADNGIKIVTYETLPYRDGKSITGLLPTFRDDYSLARLSLETLLDYSPGGDERPARVIRIGGRETGVLPIDRRNWVFDAFVNEGKIEEAALINISNTNNPHGTAWEKLAALLPSFPRGTVDAVWVPWNQFAGGCAEALAAEGRRDIKLISIGLSNDDLRLMQRHSGIWLAGADVDTKLAGTVNMRLLAAMLAGEPLPETFLFAPQLVKTQDLNRGVNIANMRVMIPGWGDGEGLFDQYQWMIDLKAAGGRYFRIPQDENK